MTGRDNHILLSYSFNKDGKTDKLNKKDVAQELQNEGLAWVHLDAKDALTKTWLDDNVSYLDHLIIDALTAEETRPRVMQFESGILVIIRSVNLNSNSDPEDMVSLRIWIDECRIITIQRRNMKAVADLVSRIESGKTIKSSGEFLYNLLYSSLSDTTTFIYGLAEVLDVLEEKIGNSHDMKFREQVTQIRSQSAIFKRYLVPQRDVIKKLQNIDQPWIDEWAKRHFRENYDAISYVIEEAEEIRDRSQILHDELSNALSEKLNSSMYKLSIITAIFMPLTFVTGIFGMNIGGVPGIANPEAFDLCMCGMILIFLFQVLFFKRGKWF